MIQDRVRRTWESGRAINPWLIHPPILFAMLLHNVWLNADVAVALGDVRWWEMLMLGRAMGDLTLGDFERLQWALVAVYFLVCAVGAFLALRPVRLDPAPWRPAALGAILLAGAVAAIGLLVTRTGPTPSEFVTSAADDLDRRAWTEPLAWALDADLPGARQEILERLETPDQGMRALLAATLVSRGDGDPEVGRALRSGFEDGLDLLERECRRTGHNDGDDANRVLHHLLLAWHTIDPDALRSSPFFRRWSLNPESVADVRNWWQASRERLTGDS